MNNIFNESCLETMSRMQDKSIDLILTDPPYGINMEYDLYEDSEANWFELMGKTLPEIIRVSKMALLPAGNRYALSFFYKNFPPLWMIIWHKGSPGHRSPIGFNDYEPILVYGKADGIQMHDYFSINNTEKMGENGHPCAKPIKWAKWLIQRASKENDIVYDPFIGSGTTAIACIKLNRNFLGSEISSTYCDIANKRIEQELSQLKLAI